MFLADFYLSTFSWYDNVLSIEISKISNQCRPEGFVYYGDKKKEAPGRTMANQEPLLTKH